MDTNTLRIVFALLADLHARGCDSIDVVTEQTTLYTCLCSAVVRLALL